VEDLDVIGKTFSAVAGPILLQISSYSANNGNPHDVVEESISGVLARYGFDCRARVEADGNMISLMYTRKVSPSRTVLRLGEKFKKWLGGRQ